MTLAVGTILINRYRIARLVGQGGFGAVYRAWDLSLSQPVALKENSDGGIESQRQFEREAKLLAGLRHPNLPVVIDHFILPGQGQYLVMDFVEGKSLGDLMIERGQPLSEAEVLPWIRQVCDALDYLHSRQPPVIHRDIKPDNIIITNPGGATSAGRAMLVDFGISKEFDPGKGTTIGAKAVTPGFSPPEQYASGKTDARSDVYALGATLYTLLTGQIPPEGPNLSSGAAVLSPPRQVNRAVSETVSAAIIAAMSPTISQRLGSATALGQALAGQTRAAAPVAAGSRAAAPSAGTVAPPAAPPRRRRRWPVGCLLLLLVLLAAAGGAWLALGRPTSLDEVVRGVTGATPGATLPAGATAVAATGAPGATTVPPATTGEATVDPAAPTKTIEPTPSATAGPDDTSAAATTPAPTASATAPAPTATKTPAPAAPPLAGGVVRVNQPWEQEGVSLNVTALDFYAEAEGGDAAARAWFRLINKTGQRLLVDIDWSTIHLEDSLGNRYIDWEIGAPTSVWVEAGDNFDFNRYYGVIPDNRSRVPAEASFVQVVVDQFSRVTNARWQTDINPVLSPVAAPAEGAALGMGEAWEGGGLSLRLTGLEVYPYSDGNDAAARAWFELSNLTGQEALVEIDFGRIALSDGFGRRFGDWEGGGLWAATIGAGDTLAFNRYYSERSGRHSRITRGSPFVVVTAEGIGDIAVATWQVPVDTRLSVGLLPPQSAPLVINQPWEQAGVSLTARAIDVYTEDNGGDAAARVWFRLVNKTGRRLLLALDWDAIYLEDSEGTRYNDWEGGTTSVWVEDGSHFDFDRYYSVIPDSRSRVPAGAGAVQIVVDSLAGIAGARWQLELNPQPQPVAAPPAETTRAVGETWEQDGLAIRLTDLAVYAESDGGDAAARAWFEVANNTNHTVLAEIDLGHLALVDSFGRRFGDYEGGGLYAVALEPGETTAFNRYYSEMSGRFSRITRGSEFVLMTMENVAGIPSGKWRLDIVR